MYVLKYKVGDEVVYRLSESSMPSNLVLKKESLVAPAKKADSAMTHFDAIDRVFKEKTEEPKTASISNVLRRYASAIKED